MRLPPRRKTGVPSTRSLAIRLAGLLALSDFSMVWVAGMVIDLLAPDRKTPVASARSVLSRRAGIKAAKLGLEDLAGGAVRDAVGNDHPVGNRPIRHFSPAEFAQGFRTWRAAAARHHDQERSL